MHLVRGPPVSRDTAREPRRRAVAGGFLVLVVAGVILILDLSGEHGDGVLALGPGQGLLVATTSPRVDATILVDGHARNTGTLTGLPLSAGEHVICFEPVHGYLEPPCEPVTIRAGRRTGLVGRFEPAGILEIHAEDDRRQPQVRVDGVPRDRVPVVLTLAEGEHQVCVDRDGTHDGFSCRAITIRAGARHAYQARADGSLQPITDPGRS